MIRLRQDSPEVYYSEDRFASFNGKDILELKGLAAKTPRRRCRICFHDTPEATLHEMLIVHEKNAWVPPHKHLEKDESIHVIEGSAVLVGFSEDGRKTNVVRIGDGGSIYCRIPSDIYHTLLINSDWLVFHESTTGPFDRSRTKVAPWAPSGGDPESRQFIENLRHNL